MSNRVPGNPNVVNSLLRGTGINLAGLVVRFVFIFLQSLLAVRLYGTELFGVYIVAISAVNLLSYTGQLGFSRTVVRYVGLYIARDQWGNIAHFLRLMLIFTAVWSIFLGITLNFASDYLTSLFSEVRFTNLLVIIGLAIPGLTIATLLGAFTQGFGAMQYKVIALDILAPVFEVILLVAFWRMGFQETGLMLSYTVSLLVATLFLCWATMRFLARVKVKSAEHPAIEKVALRPIMQFTFYAWLSLLLRHATRPVNIFLIGALGTAVMVGIYSVLERLVAVGVLFLMSINSMLAPMVAKLIEKKDLTQLGRIYMLAARWSLIVCLPVFVFLGVFGEQVLSLFGADFVSGAPALWYLAGAWIFSLLTGPADVILMMSGRSHYSAVNQIIMICLIVGLGWWFIPVWGLIGAVSAFALATVVVNILRVIQVQIHLKINPFGPSTAKVIFAGVLMLVCMLVLQNILSVSREWLNVILLAFAGLAVYLLVLLAVRLEEEETHALAVLRKRLLPSHA